MKKYLISTVLAIVFTNFLSSCRDSEIEYSSIAEAKQAQFAENFEKFFGQVNPNQTWGFGESTASSKTRAVYADANEWAASDGQKWKVPPVLTDEQKTIVRIYFQNVEKPSYQDPGWSDYFMQQVYKGHTTGQIGTHSPEQYKAANNADYILASDHMDHLAAIDESKGILDHINNFNHGDCGVYGNVLDYTHEVQYTKNDNAAHHHADKINLMVGSTTKSFGYYNSDGSVRHTNYTGLVNWETIKTWADSHGHQGEADCLNDGWNRSFMGFDFEQMVGSDIYSGATFVFEGQTYHFLSSNTNMYCADRNEKSYSQEGGVAHFDNTPNDDTIRDLLSKGYLPYSDTKKDWVKVGGCADGYYSDWIVCLTKAERYGTPVTNGGNTGAQTTSTDVYIKKEIMFHKWVFCEDLGSSSKREDFDYNDLVFDVKIIDEYRVILDNGVEYTYTGENPHRYYALVTPLAAGGELAIKFEKADKNIHAMFTPEMGDNILLNTARENTTLVTPHKEDLVGNTYELALDDPTTAPSIDVINNINIVVRTTNVVYGLNAYKGEAPHKLCVDPGTRWPYERTAIDIAYTGFTTYVGGGSEPWNTGVEENLYPLTELAEQMAIGGEGYAYEYVKDEENSTSETTYSLNPGSSETVVWSDLTGNTNIADWNVNKIIGYNDLAKADPNRKAFGKGSIIRLYVITREGFSVQMSAQDDQAHNWGWTKLIEANADANASHISGNGGYVEYQVTEEALEILKRGGLALHGKDYIALGVTVDNTLVTSGGTTIWGDGPQSLAWDLNLTIAKEKFANASSTSIMRFHGTGNGGNMQIWLKTTGWQDIAKVVELNNDWPSSNYVNFTIGEYLNTLQNNDISVQGTGVSLTKIELIP